jgi:TonB family protein
MTWWQYLVLVNIYLLLFYGFYAILLSRETFFQLNRVYLVSAALLSFFIPLIQSDWVKNLFITQKVQYTIYSSPVLLYRFKPVQDTHFTIGQLMTIAYLAGITFLVGRFILQLISLNKIIKEKRPLGAWSFFKKITLDTVSEDREIIAAHENVHAREWHSADVLIMEAIMIINWFNPVVYLYRFAVKHIHEFIADQKALKSGTTKADYAMILLSQTFNAPAHQLVNPFFNKSLLKLRIMMLQKNKSHRVALIKYFLSAPLFILMLILSSATVNDSKTIRLIDKKVEMVLLKPAMGGQDIKINSGPLNQIGFSPAKADKTIPLQVKVAEIQLENANDTTPKKDDKVFSAVEHSPEFPGGIDGFFSFLGKNIRYPGAARDNNVQGRVIISFIVEEDGALTNFKVLRGIGAGCDEEAIRVLALSPKWKPGVQNGKLVRVAYSVPIAFELEQVKVGKVEVDKAGVKDGSQRDEKISLRSMNLIVSKTDAGMKVDTVNTKDPSLLPLYIVDGNEVDYTVTINPIDIESITVLKDKTKTALYGPKAINGVVIIKLKKGKVFLAPIVPAKN